VRPEHVHLTLVFIGAIEEPRAAALVEAMRADVPLAPFALAFGGLGTFPPHGAPRVLWLGLLEGGRETIALQEAIARRAQQAGAALDARPFHPHLTLARWRDRRPRGRFPRLEGGDLVARDRAEAVTLYESRPSASGPAYTRLARARLTCP
jgi:2'-5' RNA ligase